MERKMLSIGDKFPGVSVTTLYGSLKCQTHIQVHGLIFSATPTLHQCTLLNSFHKTEKMQKKDSKMSLIGNSATKL